MAVSRAWLQGWVLPILVLGKYLPNNSLQGLCGSESGTWIHVTYPYGLKNVESAMFFAAEKLSD